MAAPKTRRGFSHWLGLVMGWGWGRGGDGAVSSAHLRSRPAALGEGKGLRSQRSLVANWKGTERSSVHRPESVGYWHKVTQQGCGSAEAWNPRLQSWSAGTFVDNGWPTEEGN